MTTSFTRSDDKPRIRSAETIDARYLDLRRGRTVIGINTEGNIIGHRDGDAIVQFDGIKAMVTVPVTKLKRLGAPTPATHERP